MCLKIVSLPSSAHTFDLRRMREAQLEEQRIYISGHGSLRTFSTELGATLNSIFTGIMTLNSGLVARTRTETLDRAATIGEKLAKFL